MTKIELGVNPQDLINVIGNVTSPFVVLSELVKNGVDANAKAVTIHINTKEKKMEVIDDGDGFTLEDIQNIGEVAKSNKKRSDKMYTKDGLMMLGSKGLAIYSVFYLGKEVLIKTKNHLHESFKIKWNKEEMAPTYERINDSEFSYGTEIIISDIDDNIISLLSTERELEKFKHLSVTNFKEEMLIPKLTLIIDREKYPIDVNNIKEIENDFDSIVKFNYNSKEEIIHFHYYSKDSRVSNKNLKIKIKDINKIDKVLEENYNFKPENLGIKDYIIEEFMTENDIVIPNFEGAFYVKAKRKTKKMNNFGHGVRLFINGFALYKYLDENYDWLNLSDISANKKFNNFKKHNVYGYINFSDFNDNKEDIKISNERGGLIENINYYKFIGIIYSFILYPAINIDIATRNNKFFRTSLENEEGSKDEEDLEIEKKSLDVKENLSDYVPQKGTNSPTEKTEVQSIKDNGKSKRLKTPSLKIQEGDHVYLKDPTIIDLKGLNLKDLKIVPRNENTFINDEFIFTGSNSLGIHEIYYFYNNERESFKIKVNKARVKWSSEKEKNFFESSNHFIGDIDLTAINPIVNQLKGLDYETKYLLYVVSFRVIIEDITKSYLYKRDISLSGQLKKDIENMIVDMQQTLRISKNDYFKDSKKKIHNKFKGYNALKNFLVSLNVKFQNSDYEQLLHSLTHNPSKIQKSLALEIANDIILPLYLLEKNLTEYKII